MKEGEAQIMLRQAASHLRVATALLTAACEDMDEGTIDMFTDNEYDDINQTRQRLKKELMDLNNFLAGRA